MVKEEINQKVKGNQNITNVNINNLNGLTFENAVTLIQSYGYVNKEEVINIFRDLIEQIPSDNRIMPDKRIFVPAIQQLSYSLDDDSLRTSYENLLRASMDKTKAQSIHPSFVNILGQLNSDEIKLLNSLPITTFVSHPCIDARIVVSGQNGLGVKYLNNFTNIGEGICEFPDNVGTYLENLERLKIIEIPDGIYMSDDKNYEPLIEHPKIKKAAELLNVSKYGKIETDKKIFRFTSFGESFMKCCKKENK